MLTRARARATRCCWPPESWRGLRRGERRHLHHLERLADPSLRLALVDTLLPQAVRDVLGDGHVRKERVVLEHRVHVALVRRHALHVGARDADVALVGLLEAREHPQRRGLAAAARPEEREELAGLHVEVERVDRDRGAEPLGDVGELDRPALAGHACSSRSRCVHLPAARPRAHHRNVGDLMTGDRADVGRQRAEVGTLAHHDRSPRVVLEALIGGAGSVGSQCLRDREPLLREPTRVGLAVLVLARAPRPRGRGEGASTTPASRCRS